MCMKSPMRICGADKELSHCGECSEYFYQHIETFVLTGNKPNEKL